MRVTFMQNGNVYLHVLATAGQNAVCEALEGNGSVESCVQAGLDAFDTVFVLRLN
jgi:hypothetical protein